MASAFCRERDAEANALRMRLGAFYVAPRDYVVFTQKNWKPEALDTGALSDRVRSVDGAAVPRARVRRRLQRLRRVLADVRARVEFHVQDVTAANEAHLRGMANEVHLKDLLELDAHYDVIFSTFAWEHLTRPQTLQHLLGMQSPGGELLMASPRYDFPLYISPSAPAQGAARCARALRALAPGLDDSHRAPGVPASQPTRSRRSHAFIDPDAIHWVSLWDLCACLGTGWKVERLRIPARGVLGRFWEKYLLMFLRVTRRP